jgi:hypothetical protein
MTENKFWSGVFFTLLIIFGLLIVCSSVSWVEDCARNTTITFFWFTYTNSDCVSIVFALDKFIAGMIIILFSCYFVNTEDKYNSEDV